MNRVCSLIVAIALMSSVLMAQISPTVPLGHWTYDAFKELEEVGVVKRPSGVDANTAYTRDQATTILIEAVNSVRKNMDALPALPKLRFSDIAMASRTERERYQKLLETATDLSKQVRVVLKLSIEFQDELAARSVDVTEPPKLSTDLENAISTIRRALSLFSFRQDGPGVNSDHWAYDAVRKMIADGVLTGFRVPTKESYQQTTPHEFARMVMTVPAILEIMVAKHEAAVNRWCDEMSHNHQDVETETKLLSEGVILSQHNVTQVALCYEFSGELQALGFDPGSIKKTAMDIQIHLNKAERAMNSARYTAQNPKTAQSTMVIPEWVVPNPNMPPVSGWRLPPSRDDFDQFWRNFRYSQ